MNTKEITDSDTPRTDKIAYHYGGDLTNATSIISLLNEMRHMERELNDYKNSEKFALDLSCSSVEKHCGCVPLLLKKINELTLDLSTINAERQETKALRQAWIECDNKRQELQREVNILKLEIQKFE